METSIRKWLWSSEAIGKSDEYKLLQGTEYPVLLDLVTISIPCTVVFILVRYLVERMIARTVARKFIFKSKTASIPLSSVLNFQGNEFEPLTEKMLEQIHREVKPKLPDPNKLMELKRLSKDKATIPQLNRWFTIRMEIEKDEVKAMRFSESLWRFLVFTLAMVIGISSLRGESWYQEASQKSSSFVLSDETSKALWDGFPMSHTISSAMKFYYIALELPFYLHLIVYHVMDDSRSYDFWEMFNHHALAVVLITFSYIANFLRIGCIVLLCHDITEIMFEASKMVYYLRNEFLTIVFFNAYAFCWAYFRLYRFGSVCLRSALLESKDVAASTISFSFFNILLGLLFIRNLYFFRLILLRWRDLMWKGSSGSTKSKDEDDNSEMSTDNDTDSSILSDFDDSTNTKGGMMKKHED